MYEVYPKEVPACQHFSMADLNHVVFLRTVASVLLMQSIASTIWQVRIGPQFGRSAGQTWKVAANSNLGLPGHLRRNMLQLWRFCRLITEQTANICYPICTRRLQARPCLAFIDWMFWTFLDPLAARMPGRPTTSSLLQVHGSHCSSDFWLDKLTSNSNLNSQFPQLRLV